MINWQALSVLFLLLNAYSCGSQKKTQSQCGEEGFTVQKGSIGLAGIAPGNKLVFEYICQTKNFSETITHDEGRRESILFEAEAGNHAFFFQDEQLQRANTKISRTCFCPPADWQKLTGTIEGRQTDPGQWEVTIDVVALDAGGKEVMRIKSSGLYKL